MKPSDSRIFYEEPFQPAPGTDWWPDNSMMDANVQQMKTFYSNLRGLPL